MIKLTWGNIRDENFIIPLRKVLETPMDFELTQKALLLGKKIQEQQKLCNDTFDSLLKTYGTPNKETPGSYDITQERRAEYGAEMLKLSNHEFSVRLSRFDALKLDTFVKLSALDLMALEPIIAPFEVPVEPDLQLQLEANH